MRPLIPENAQQRSRLARPLSSFTPEQRRLLLALIEAGTPTPSPCPSGRNPRRPDGGARPTNGAHTAATTLMGTAMSPNGAVGGEVMGTAIGGIEPRSTAEDPSVRDRGER
jgi:hypothetical protein